MRPASVPLLGFAFLVLAPLSCSSETGEKVIRASQAIQGGVVDKNDPAVVSILINTSQGMSLCSGALVAPNLVLSAHHCVADPPTNLACGHTFGTTYAASSFVVTTDYAAAGLIFNSNNPVFPTPDGVTWFGVGSVSVPGTNICGQDLSALQLSSAITSVCPLIPNVDADVVSGETYEAIGFGITSPSGTTAGTRYKVGGMVVQCAESCGDPTMSTTEEWLGGSSNAQGTCEGDSGGPAIDSIGRVIGSVSRGPSNVCNSTVYESYYGERTWIKAVGAQAATAGAYTAAGWVTGGSTSDPANGYCAAVVTDAGASDAGATVDGGGQDAGGGATDGGASSDAGTGDSGIVTGSDSGAMDAGEDGGTIANEDSGTPSDDADTPSDDAGTINPPPDAGIGEDAGITTGTDAGTSAPGQDASADAADDAGGSSSGDASAGCGCTVVGAGDSRTGSGALGGVLFGLVTVARRRRARRG